MVLDALGKVLNNTINDPTYVKNHYLSWKSLWIDEQKGEARVELDQETSKILESNNNNFWVVVIIYLTYQIQSLTVYSINLNYIAHVNLKQLITYLILKQIKFIFLITFKTFTLSCLNMFIIYFM